MKQAKITATQFGFLVFMFSVGTSILITPAILAKGSQQSAWVPALIGIVGGLLLVLLFNKLGSKFGQLSFYEYCEKVLGRWIGRFVVILYTLFAFITASILLWIQGNFLIINIYSETPAIFLQGIFAFSVLTAINFDVRNVARSVQIFMPWVLFLLLFMALALIPEYDFKKIQPALDFDWKPTISASFSFISVVSSPLVLLLTIFTKVEDRKQAQKQFLLGNLSGGMVLLGVALMTVSTLGADLTANQVFPTYTVAKKIKLGTFLSRIEVILAIIWIITIYYKTYLYYYAAVIGFTHAFKIKDFRSISIPFTILFAILSINIYPNTSFASEWNVNTWIPLSLTFGFVLPILLLTVGGIRKRMENTKKDGAE